MESRIASPVVAAKISDMGRRRDRAMSLRRIASLLQAHWRDGRPNRAFLHGESGAIAIYFGLSALIFVGVAGLAVDAARGYLVKARLSQAIDAAALAGGKALTTGNTALVNADVTAFFNANFPNGAMGANVAQPQIAINPDLTIVNVTSTAVIPTTLMRVLGFQNMTAAAAASVSRSTNGLDVVFSFDVSGSMGDSPKGGGARKIDTLKTNAKALVDTLAQPYSSGTQQQKVTIQGVEYSLLNIGVVPWSSKVNVLTYPNTSAGASVGPSGGAFANPMGGRQYGSPPTYLPLSSNLPGVFKVANSEVPLLLDPNDGTNVPGGWKGCVYARYWEDGSESSDADTKLGTTDPGTWRGWEPVPNAEGDSGYNNGFGCYASYWNDNNQAKISNFPNRPWPQQDGTFKPIPTPGWWIPSASGPNLRSSNECAQCPEIGILPLQPDYNAVKSMIDALDPKGATDAPQGLFWAWEVLMPGQPFDEAKVSTPFPRVQAIVFMTDGQNWGSNGDAYHGWYGDDTSAGTITTKTGKITLPDGTKLDNNLNNKVLELATKIKGTNPLAGGAVKIYVIQYDTLDPALTTLLKKVATSDQFYFQASTNAQLEAAFKKIASSLSALRLIQ
ncbi:TadE/TadG family type IV pilus assembly protein [Dongia sedimenti]|uniref:Pilus assembly protein n=1 Tax=Dongia sedimenti TaxID=3064282 RepID=A0ABU0YQA1_9PROT|nr:pilus assembly protein [Rhodospirillaceae bacterium R-7]